MRIVELAGTHERNFAAISAVGLTQHRDGEFARLADAAHLAVRGENAVDQRGPAAGHSQHEHRPAFAIARTRLAEEGFVEGLLVQAQIVQIELDIVGHAAALGIRAALQIAERTAPVLEVLQLLGKRIAQHGLGARRLQRRPENRFDVRDVVVLGFLFFERRTIVIGFVFVRRAAQQGVEHVLGLVQVAERGVARGQRVQRLQIRRLQDAHTFQAARGIAKAIGLAVEAGDLGQDVGIEFPVGLQFPCCLKRRLDLAGAIQRIEHQRAAQRMARVERLNPFGDIHQRTKLAAHLVGAAEKNPAIDVLRMPPRKALGHLHGGGRTGAQRIVDAAEFFGDLRLLALHSYSRRSNTANGVQETCSSSSTDSGKARVLPSGAWDCFI